MRKLLLILVIGIIHVSLHAINVTATVTPTACTPCNGNITATASAGTAPYQYSIDGGVTWQSSGLFSGLCAATYTITAKDALNATAIVNATVVQNAPLSFTLSGVNCSNMTTCNGQIIVNITGGVPPYTIHVLGPVSGFYTSSPITNRCPGTYTVTVVDASNNCGFGYSPPQTITITGGASAGPGGLYCNSGYTVGQCNQICDNSLTASGSGGTPPYMYSLNGGPYTSSPTFSSLCEGNNTYTVCVRDAAMNTWCGSAYYPTNNPYIRFPPAVTASGCSCTGTITFNSPAPFEQFYVYQNSVLIAQNTTGSFTGLCGGSYVVNSSLNGCYCIFPVVIPTNPSFSVTITGTNPTCYGGCNGTITCTPNPFSPTGYQYSKDNGVTWQSSNAFTGLCAGTFNLRVKDSTNCYGNYTYTISNPAQLALTVSAIQPNCLNGNCFGGMTCTPATGPTAPYQWSADGGATWQSSNQFLNHCAGTYTMKVMDVNGCTRTTSTTLSSSLFQYYLGNTHGNPTCANPCGGYINLTLGSSNAPAANNLYSIDSGLTWQSGLGFSNLCAGTYHAQAKNTLTGCYSAFLTIVLSSAATLAISASSTQASCISPCNGTMQATITSAANPPYQYSKDGGVTWQASSLFTGMCAGTYTITAKNSLSCTATQTVVVNSVPVVSASATTSGPVCHGDCNGTLTVTASSTPPQSFQYSIDGGATWYASGLFSGLCAGGVNIQVKDSYNCISNTAATLSNPPVVAASISATPPLCSDVCNGSIVLNPTQPVGYIYSIDSGLTWQGATNYSGLCAGPYTVIIHDAAGCGSDSTFTFIAPPPIAASTNVTSISCTNMCDGAITLNTSPSGSYSYSLDSGLTWQSGNSFTNLCAGQYDFMVRDSNLCSAYGTEILNAPLPVAASISSQVNATCFGDCNGSLIMGVSPSGTYQFSIDSAQNWQSVNQFMDLCAGNYTMIVENVNGCHDTVIANIGQPDPLVLALDVSDVSCNHWADGMIEAHTFSHGAIFSLDSLNWGTDSVFINLPSGPYTVYMFDSAGCNISTTAVVILSPNIYTQVSTTDETCGQCNGSAQLATAGGNPGYSYVWSPSSANGGSNMCAGTYTVVTTDANGCTDSDVVTIVNDLTFGIDSTSATPSVANQTTGTAGVYVWGNGPFSFQWDANAGNQTTATATNLAPGNYCVWVTDVNGCTDSTCVTVGVLTNVDPFVQVQYSVYPNPVTNLFTVEGMSGEMNVLLYDASGRIVKDYGAVQMNPTGRAFDLPHEIADGNYMLEMTYGDAVFREKIAVVR